MAVFFVYSPPRDPVSTGADGTDVPLMLSHQARATPPLLKLCAPRHGNNDTITSKTSLIRNLIDTMLVSTQTDEEKTQQIENGVFSAMLTRQNKTESSRKST